MLKQDIHTHDTFLYFAYGANLLGYRVKWFNPTAEFVSIARLDNYRLDFSKFSQFWGGPIATIVPTANAQTWGLIWRLHNNDLVSLDDQKRVDEKHYFIKYVTVHTPYMGDFLCRTYIQKIYPLPKGDHDPMPVERWPSWSYKQILIMGAEHHQLPAHYIRFLKKIKDNGDIAFWLLALMLKRYTEREPCQCRVPGVIPRKPLKLKVKKPFLHLPTIKDDEGILKKKKNINV